MVSSRPFGVPPLTVPLMQQEDIPTPVDMLMVELCEKGGVDISDESCTI